MRENVLQVQKYLNKQGAEPKLVEDGLWGAKTSSAYQQMVARKRIALQQSSPWPEGTDGAITAFFGPHGVEGGHTPPMGQVESPFPMYLYGNRHTVVRTLNVHKKIVEPYARVLDRIWDFYNQDQAELDRTGFTSYYGCYNPRKMRNSQRWSKHAWAIATDHDADRNQLKSPRQNAWMPEEIIDLFEMEGATSLGRYYGYDFQHLQWTLP